MSRRLPACLVLLVAMVAAPVALAARDHASLRHRAGRHRMASHRRHRAGRRHRTRHHAARNAAMCTGAFSGVRNPADPLMVAHPDRTDPLRGARLFVDGPRHGMAAGAIAELLGRSPQSFPASETWAQFRASLHRGAFARRLAASPALARQVALLSRIAAQPEENRFSLYSGGGGPGAVLSQLHNFFCGTMASDPHTVSVITTFFLYQHGYCETPATILAYRSRFRRQVDEFAAGIGRRPAVVMVEIDAIGAARCMERNGGLGLWEQNIAYEVGRVAALPHTVAYVEGGYPDGNPPSWTARALRAVGVRRIRGFFVNDGHNEWTRAAIRWGTAVSRLVGGAHFIVNTATNGRGPLLNAHPARQGIEYLCNAPGRGLGPTPTAYTRFRRVDGYLWTGVPGNSAGGCNGGPAAGTFWPAQAMALAARASSAIG